MLAAFPLPGYGGEGLTTPQASTIARNAISSVTGSTPAFSCVQGEVTYGTRNTYGVVFYTLCILLGYE